MKKDNDFIKKIKKTIIVSCQAVDNEPLNNPFIMSKMALACTLGGAKVLRVSQKKHIKAIKKEVNNELIGLIKKHYDNSEVVITPTLKEIKELLKLNVKVIALDATLRKRPAETLEQIVNYIKANYPHQLIMADCSTLEDIKNAEILGFDFIGTTLRGYTKETLNTSNKENNFEFIKQASMIVKKSKLIVEGGIWTTKEANFALNIKNVHALVIGSAITRPKEITNYFLTNSAK